jgi:hypothetical protein
MGPRVMPMIPNNPLLHHQQMQNMNHPGAPGHHQVHYQQRHQLQQQRQHHHPHQQAHLSAQHGNSKVLYRGCPISLKKPTQFRDF